MLETLQAWQRTVAKKRGALVEEGRLENALATRDFHVLREPFPHLVVDNIFKPEVYASIERCFTTIFDKGLSEEADATRFNPFLELNKLGKEWEYDGYVYVPSPADGSALELFYSLEWNLLFSRLFRQPTDWATSLAFHHHPPGNRTGFVHNDYSLKHFSIANTLSNGMVYREIPHPRAGDPRVFGTMRTIAILFYIGNASVTEEEGGGTGLYGERGMEPVKVVAPRANRLLAFQISPKSFHAFQTNRTNRNSIAQWFHMTPAWCQKAYGHI